MRKIFMPLILAAILVACKDQKQSETPMVKTATASEPSSTKQMPAEFADPKYMDIGKKLLSSMEQGNFDNWSSMYADNARFLWSGGDSLVGKKAILDYWKARRTNVIESVTFSSDIYTPLKVNQPQKGPDRAGVWLLTWYMVNVKYKNAKHPIQFWVHTDHHFNADDKIDQTVQYIDRLPIEKAMRMK